MTPEQTAVAVAVDLALLTTAAALIVRSRWRLCWGLAVYVAVVVGYNVSVLLWPQQFYKAWFWTAAHGVFETVRMWIALEIAWRVFRKVPDRRATLLVLIGIAVLTTAARVDVTGWGLLASNTWSAWLSSGPLLIMAATLLIARWDRLTLHPFHTAVLTSFAAYQAVFELLTPLYAYGMPSEPLMVWLRHCEPFAFLALACFWAYIAWRPAPRNISSGPGPMTAGAGEGDAQSGHTSESWRMFQRWGFLSASRSSTEA